MSTIIIDTEMVDAYVSAAQTFNEQISSAASGMRSAFDELGSSWRDANYQRANQTYAEFEGLVTQFNEQAAALHARIADLARRAADLNF